MGARVARGHAPPSLLLVWKVPGHLRTNPVDICG
jgi:hypothetical protein